MNWHDGRWYLFGVLWWGLDDRLRDALRDGSVRPWPMAAVRLGFAWAWVGIGAALNAVFG